MDRYDEAIAYLTAHPDEIYNAWRTPTYSRGGCLFAYTGKDPTDARCGYLTQVHNPHSDTMAGTRELTELISADPRIPNDPLTITVEHLPVFAEWQRRLDRELSRDWSEAHDEAED